MTRKLMQDEESRLLSYIHDTAHTDKLYNKYDDYQRAMYDALLKHRVVTVDAKAGTGKTTIATHAGIDFLRRGVVKRILYLRFPSDRGESLGFEPGALANKEAKYMIPFYQALAECGLQGELVTMLTGREVLEMATDVTLRGVNIPNTFVIIDEAQNARDLQQFRLLVTRVFDSSPTAIIGDSNQADSRIKRYTKYNLTPFQLYQHHFMRKNWGARCDLKYNYRGVVAQWADEIEKTIEMIDGGAMTL